MPSLLQTPSIPKQPYAQTGSVIRGQEKPEIDRLEVMPVTRP